MYRAATNCFSVLKRWGIIVLFFILLRNTSSKANTVKENWDANPFSGKDGAGKEVAYSRYNRDKTREPIFLNENVSKYAELMRIKPAPTRPVEHIQRDPLHMSNHKKKLKSYDLKGKKGHVNKRDQVMQAIGITPSSNKEHSENDNENIFLNFAPLSGENSNTMLKENTDKNIQNSQGNLPPENSVKKTIMVKKVFISEESEPGLQIDIPPMDNLMDLMSTDTENQNSKREPEVKGAQLKFPQFNQRQSETWKSSENENVAKEIKTIKKVKETENIQIEKEIPLTKIVSTESDDLMLNVPYNFRTMPQKNDFRNNRFNQVNLPKIGKPYEVDQQRQPVNDESSRRGNLLMKNDPYNFRLIPQKNYFKERRYDQVTFPNAEMRYEAEKKMPVTRERNTEYDDVLMPKEYNYLHSRNNYLDNISNDKNYNLNKRHLTLDQGNISNIKNENNSTTQPTKRAENILKDQKISNKQENSNAKEKRTLLNRKEKSPYGNLLMENDPYNFGLVSPNNYVQEDRYNQVYFPKTETPYQRGKQLPINRAQNYAYGDISIPYNPYNFRLIPYDQRTKEYNLPNPINDDHDPISYGNYYGYRKKRLPLNQEDPLILKNEELPSTAISAKENTEIGLSDVPFTSDYSELNDIITGNEENNTDMSKTTASQPFQNIRKRSEKQIEKFLPEKPDDARDVVTNFNRHDRVLRGNDLLMENDPYGFRLIPQTNYFWNDRLRQSYFPKVEKSHPFENLDRNKGQNSVYGDRSMANDPYNFRLMPFDQRENDYNLQNKINDNVDPISYGNYYNYRKKRLPLNQKENLNLKNGKGLSTTIFATEANPSDVPETIETKKLNTVDNEENNKDAHHKTADLSSRKRDKIHEKEIKGFASGKLDNGKVVINVFNRLNRSLRDDKKARNEMNEGLTESTFGYEQDPNNEQNYTPNEEDISNTTDRDLRHVATNQINETLEENNSDYGKNPNNEQYVTPIEEKLVNVTDRALRDNANVKNEITETSLKSTYDYEQGVNSDQYYSDDEEYFTNENINDSANVTDRALRDDTKEKNQMNGTLQENTFDYEQITTNKQYITPVEQKIVNVSERPLRDNNNARNETTESSLNGTLDYEQSLKSDQYYTGDEEDFVNENINDSNNVTDRALRDATEPENEISEEVEESTFNYEQNFNNEKYVAPVEEEFENVTDNGSDFSTRKARKFLSSTEEKKDLESARTTESIFADKKISKNAEKPHDTEKEKSVKRKRNSPYDDFLMANDPYNFGLFDLNNGYGRNNFNQPNMAKTDKMYQTEKKIPADRHGSSRYDDLLMENDPYNFKLVPQHNYFRNEFFRQSNFPKAEKLHHPAKQLPANGEESFAYGNALMQNDPYNFRLIPYEQKTNEYDFQNPLSDNVDPISYDNYYNYRKKRTPLGHENFLSIKNDKDPRKTSKKINKRTKMIFEDKNVFEKAEKPPEVEEQKQLKRRKRSAYRNLLMQNDPYNLGLVPPSNDFRYNWYNYANFPKTENPYQTAKKISINNNANAGYGDDLMSNDPYNFRLTPYEQRVNEYKFQNPTNDYVDPISYGNYYNQRKKRILSGQENPLNLKNKRHPSKTAKNSTKRNNETAKDTTIVRKTEKPHQKDKQVPLNGRKRSAYNDVLMQNDPYNFGLIPPNNYFKDARLTQYQPPKSEKPYQREKQLPTSRGQNYAYGDILMPNDPYNFRLIPYEQRTNEYNFQNQMDSYLDPDSYSNYYNYRKKRFPLNQRSLNLKNDEESSAVVLTDENVGVANETQPASLQKITKTSDKEILEFSPEKTDNSKDVMNDPDRSARIVRDDDHLTENDPYGFRLVAPNNYFWNDRFSQSNFPKVQGPYPYEYKAPKNRGHSSAYGDVLMPNDPYNFRLFPYEQRKNDFGFQNSVDSDLDPISYGNYYNYRKKRFELGQEDNVSLKKRRDSKTTTPAYENDEEDLSDIPSTDYYSDLRTFGHGENKIDVNDGIPIEAFKKRIEDSKLSTSANENNDEGLSDFSSTDYDSDSRTVEDEESKTDVSYEMPIHSFQKRNETSKKQAEGFLPVKKNNTREKNHLNTLDDSLRYNTAAKLKNTDTHVKSHNVNKRAITPYADIISTENSTGNTLNYKKGFQFEQHLRPDTEDSERQIDSDSNYSKNKLRKLLSFTDSDMSLSDNENTYPGNLSEDSSTNYNLNTDIFKNENDLVTPRNYFPFNIRIQVLSPKAKTTYHREKQLVMNKGYNSAYNDVSKNKYPHFLKYIPYELGAEEYKFPNSINDGLDPTSYRNFYIYRKKRLPLTQKEPLDLKNEQIPSATVPVYKVVERADVPFINDFSELDLTGNEEKENNKDISKDPLPQDLKKLNDTAEKQIEGFSPEKINIEEVVKIDIIKFSDKEITRAQGNDRKTKADLNMKMLDICIKIFDVCQLMILVSILAWFLCCKGGRRERRNEKITVGI